MNTIKIKCHRCGNIVDGFEDELGTSGFYRLTGYWKQFARNPETVICDGCMWKDTKYQEIYGGRVADEGVQQ